ncbi:MAG: DUF4164 domain-containing protein [Crocosphaera sp.]|nr:DUF4164 domain-containing protein [Crocosphaera sp.]
MTNPIIQTDLTEILGEIKEEIKTISDRLNKIEVGQAEIKGEIKALDTKVEQLDKRVGNQEFTNRGILIGIVIVILGGVAKFFGLVGNP